MNTSSRQDRQTNCTRNFFTLPWELRQRILRYVFVDQVVPLPCYIPRFGKHLICDNISVLLVSRQMLEDCRHLVLPVVIGRIFISVPRHGICGPYIQMPFEERCQYLMRLNTWVGGNILCRLRRLVMNLDDIPVVLAPFLELEQIRLGDASENNWDGLNKDRSDEVPAMRKKRLTVIMPQLESITILITTVFISLWLLPGSEAQRFLTDSTVTTERLPNSGSSLDGVHPCRREVRLPVGKSFHCPLRAEFCNIQRGRAPCSPMSSILRYEKLALLSCIEQKEWFDDDTRQRVTISLEARTSNANMLQAVLHENRTMDLAIIEQSHAIGRRKDYKSVGMGDAGL